MLTHAWPGVRVKASGGIRTLDELLLVRKMGVARVGTSSTVAIMDEAYRRFGAVGVGTPVSPVPDTDGY